MDSYYNDSKLFEYSMTQLGCTGISLSLYVDENSVINSKRLESLLAIKMAFDSFNLILSTNTLSLLRKSFNLSFTVKLQNIILGVLAN